MNENVEHFNYFKYSRNVLDGTFLLNHGVEKGRRSDAFTNNSLMSVYKILRASFFVRVVRTGRRLGGSGGREDVQARSPSVSRCLL